MSIKHPKAAAFEQDFLLQVPPEAKVGLDCPVSVSVWVWYPTRRQDLDVALVHDLLQKSGVIVNDRQIVEQHNYCHIDKLNPRVVVEVTPSEMLFVARLRQ